MPFCSNCGCSVTETMSFCPGCGASLAAPSSVPAPVYTEPNTGYTPPETEYTQTGNYKLILINCGTCSIATAVRVLENILGYPSAQARELVHAAPVECACNLSLPQAQYLAQTLTEYGLSVSVLDSVGQYVDLNNFANTSVFDSNGNLLPAIAAALAMLTAANRVRHISRWRYTGPLPPLFRLNYRRMPPPPRRGLFAPAPRRHAPPPHRAPRPAAPRPPAPRGGMGPAGGPGRGPGGPGRGPSMGRGPGGGGRGGRGGGGGGGRR